MATTSDTPDPDKPTEQIEIERKYDVDDAAVLPGFDGLDAVGVLSARQLGTFQLEAEYFDTDGLDLAAHRITLRRRSGGTDDGWHLKLPAEVGRTELHLPLDTAADDEGAVPGPVLDPVRAIVRDRPVSLIARISTRRSITRLMGTDDAELVEIADDTVTASDVSTGTVRIWREWEAELLGGAPVDPAAGADLLDAVEDRLRSAGALPASSASKLASALGRTTLGTSGSADTEIADLDAESAASEVLLVAVRRLVKEISELDPSVRRDEPDSVHRLRTRVRRLRSVLAVYPTVFGDTDELRSRLRDLGSVLGAARDADVMLDRVRTLVGSRDDVPSAAIEALVAEWEQDRERAMDEVTAELSSERYYRLLDALDDLAAGQALGDEGSSAAEEVALAALRRGVRRVVKRGRRAASTTDDDGESLLHETRKAAKRLRYAAEAVGASGADVLGKRVRKVTDAAESVHDLLGEHRDSVLLQSRLRARATSDGHPFEYGVLHEAERHIAATALADYREALGELRKAL